VANEIYDLLGPGLLEKHYQDAFKIGLQHYGLKYECERILPVVYHGYTTGQYLRMDLVVEQTIILELKSAKKLIEENKQQLARYMRVSGLRNGILINFGGSEVEFLCSFEASPPEFA
jgi:GxxExxY protein